MSLPRTDQPRHSLWRSKGARWLAPLAGLGALLWFIARVVPKPSRAAYPCQRVAAPLASGFVIWMLGLAASGLGLRRAHRLLQRSRYMLACCCAAAAVVALLVPILITGGPARAYTPTEPRNQPMGVARGINPGRVVWVHEPDATSWDGRTGVWWTDNHTDPVVVDRMMRQAVTQVAGNSNERRAWDAIFRYHNRSRGSGNVGYQPGEKIAIKVNWIESRGYRWSNARLRTISPQMLEALLSQLVLQAGVAPADITVYDAIQYAGDPHFDRCTTAFPGVRFADNFGQQGRLKVVHDPSVAVHFGDSSVEDSGEVHLPDFVVAAKYLVNLALARRHPVLAGVTLCAKNYFGSLWRPHWLRHDGWDPSNMHCTIAAYDFYEGEPLNQHCGQVPMGSYNAMVDLLGHEHLGGKTILFLNECMWYKYWNGEPFNGDWASSLFVSQDPIAIDSVLLDFLRMEGNVAAGTVDNYLHEGGLADAPPSAAFYDPENDGTRLASLGVHEHWNSQIQKKYSRNLGTGAGIELVAVDATITTAIREERKAAAAAAPAVLLEPCFPNPFNSSTTFSYSLPETWEVELSVYTIGGQKIAALVSGVRQAGVHNLHWDGRSNAGEDLATGVYLAVLQAGDHVHTQTLTLLR
jgi:uncharacterized protein (DUF362 family)